MSRLEKVCAVWDNLEKSYILQNKKLKSKGESELTRLDFLRRLTKYTGTVDDLTKFKSMFSYEIRNYSHDELKRYENLIENVSEILEIIKLCSPTEDHPSVFTVEDHVTIDELVTIFRGYKEEAEKVVYNVNDSEEINKMNLFDKSENKEEKLTEEIAYELLKTKYYMKLTENNYENFNVMDFKNNCSFEDLFNEGKLSNYFEMVNGKISYMCVDSQYKDYVYISGKAGFYHYITWFSANSDSVDDFNKAVFLFLMNTYENAKNGKERFKFPYVFTKKEFVKETTASYVLGNVIFRKNTAKYLKFAGVEFSDLVEKVHKNTDDIIVLNVTNNGTPYTVCIVEKIV